VIYSLLGFSVSFNPTPLVRSSFQLLAFATMLAVIRWGHSWRERANEMYGYRPGAADEKHDAAPTSKDEEAAVSSDHEGAHDEHSDRPGSLVALNPTRRPALERGNSRGELPAVGEVLKRTASLSGASVHGGG
jgi:hypothetical protein